MMPSLPRPDLLRSCPRLRFPQAVAVLALCGLVWPALAQSGGGNQDKSSPLIYSCVDASGRRLTSDRPIAECAGREQRVHSRDGTPRGVLSPSMSMEEIAAREAQLQREAREREARVAEQRKDRLLLQRYPDEASHARARAAALEAPNDAIQNANNRLADLEAERRKLEQEAEFYVGKSLPATLQLLFDTNVASVAAQRTMISNQQAEIDRVNKLYDEELARLRKLWAGEGGKPATPSGKASMVSR